MNKITFNDKKLTIYTQGHFNEWLCGFVTALESVARDSKTILIVDGNNNQHLGYESTLLLFTIEEEYKNWKEQLKWAIKNDKTKFATMKQMEFSMEELVAEKGKENEKN